jgi:hypothetical protein
LAEVDFLIKGRTSRWREDDNCALFLNGSVIACTDYVEVLVWNAKGKCAYKKIGYWLFEKCRPEIARDCGLMCEGV